MPSLIDLRRRIRAIKSTQQITRAMKTVAASKLRRAQERILGARPFAIQMARVLNSLASRVDPSAHPLLAQRPGQGRVLVIVITADRGLCGSFNANIIRRASAFIVEHPGRAVALALVGRKGRDFFRRQGFDIWYDQVGIFNQLRYEHAQEIALVAIDRFTAGDVDAVHLVYSEFKSVLQQRVVIDQLLPIARADLGAEMAPAAGVEYLYEPAPEQIFTDLLPRHVEIQVYRALLESSASEHAARMTAMDAATKNSAEMIDNLTLYMNKVRQASITREIIEVISGAEAL
ncbi:MAG: ATP synthase F1 subunit gamma [Acidobacteria bacterium]|nr:ATP synthase F1 subunit gamma [Acidobacteriota bacterium]